MGEWKRENRKKKDKRLKLQEDIQEFFMLAGMFSAVCVMGYVLVVR